MPIIRSSFINVTINTPLINEIFFDQTLIERLIFQKWWRIQLHFSIYLFTYAEQFAVQRISYTEKAFEVHNVKNFSEVKSNILKYAKWWSKNNMNICTFIELVTDKIRIYAKWFIEQTFLCWKMNTIHKSSSSGK